MKRQKDVSFFKIQIVLFLYQTGQLLGGIRRRGHGPWEGSLRCWRRHGRYHVLDNRQWRFQRRVRSKTFPFDWICQGSSLWKRRNFQDVRTLKTHLNSLLDPQYWTRMSCIDLKKNCVVSKQKFLVQYWGMYNPALKDNRRLL